MTSKICYKNNVKSDHVRMRLNRKFRIRTHGFFNPEFSVFSPGSWLFGLCDLGIFCTFCDSKDFWASKIVVVAHLGFLNTPSLSILLSLRDTHIHFSQSTVFRICKCARCMLFLIKRSVKHGKNLLKLLMNKFNYLKFGFRGKIVHNELENVFNSIFFSKTVAKFMDNFR